VRADGRTLKEFANPWVFPLVRPGIKVGMGLGKALCKTFNGSGRAKEAGEAERCCYTEQVRSQSALSWRQLRTLSRTRLVRPATPVIPTLSLHRLLSKECRRFDNAFTKTPLSHTMLWYVY